MFLIPLIMKISVPGQEIWFSILYVISFILPAIVVIVACLKTKIPLRTILLMLTTLSLLTIIGSRIFTVPVSAWGKIIIDGSFEGYPGRSAVGGLVFGVLGLLLVRRFLGIDIQVLNLYALIAPVGFGIQKLGCFFNGCCYGTSSDLPWSVSYPAGTNAYHFQWVHGIIGETDAFSRSVHPVQLYEAFFLFLIAFIVWKSLKYFRKDGSSLLFAVFLFFTFRFITEFFRDPSSTYFFRQTLWGLREFQWFILFAAIVSGLIFLVNERSKWSLIGRPVSAGTLPHQILAFILTLSLMVYVFRGLFTKYEMIALDVKFVPAILLTSYYLAKTISLPSVRLSMASLLALPVLAFSQFIQQDTIKSGKPSPGINSDPPVSYMKVEAGTKIGTAYDEVLYNPVEGSCGTSYSAMDYKHEFRMAGATLSWVKKGVVSSTEKGFGLFGGTDKEFNLTAGSTKIYNIVGARGFYSYSGRWIGVGAGMNAGNLKWIPQAPIDAPYIKSGTSGFIFMPQGYLRVGRTDIIDVRYELGTSLASNFPVFLHEFSIGTGFGSKNKEGLRLGTNMSFADRSGISPNIFIEGNALISDKFGVSARFDFNNQFNYHEPVDQGSWLSLGASYRFGVKTGDSY
jgi:prolipoprotein diacylglyceryltransferase